MSKSITVIKFWGENCAPCLSYAPVFKKVSDSSAEGIEFLSIEASAHRDMVLKYGVRSVPTTVVLSDGAVQASLIGAMTETQLRDLIGGAL